MAVASCSKDSNFITYVLIQSPKTNKVLSCKLIESTNKKILKSIEYANGIVDIKKMAHYLYQLGIEDKENNELYSNAIENYSAAIELDPQNSAFYFARGLAYDSIKEPKAAIEDFNKAIELNPKNAGAYMYRGVLKHLHGNDSDALKDINIAMKYSSLASEIAAIKALLSNTYKKYHATVIFTTANSDTIENVLKQPHRMKQIKIE